MLVISIDSTASIGTQTGAISATGMVAQGVGSAEDPGIRGSLEGRAPEDCPVGLEPGACPADLEPARCQQDREHLERQDFGLERPEIGLRCQETGWQCQETGPQCQETE